MASTAAGLTLSAGWEPAERTSIRALAEGGQEGGGHLGTAGVVDADEQDGRLLGGFGAHGVSPGINEVSGRYSLESCARLEPLNRTLMMIDIESIGL